MNDTPSDVAAFVRQYGWTSFPVGLDGTGQIGNAFNVGSFPTTVFLDANGSVVNERVGGLTDADYAQEIAKISR